MPKPNTAKPSTARKQLARLRAAQGKLEAAAERARRCADGLASVIESAEAELAAAAADRAAPS